MALDCYLVMSSFKVLIVEDNPIVAMDLEHELTRAGCDVCGVVGSEAAALTVAEATRPPFAVVDVRLRPGDGRVVARQLVERYGTAVLFATSLCGDISDLAATGAVACLPKPYSPSDVPAALEVISQIRAGLRPELMPDHMKVLMP